ncbi:hypothetical protein ONS95_007144 [Cadophora gregata]|uniref:uncharacterized protein n=1 Tax=Cadophora gregata TaxID=51156 RepID=UPI0026DCE026|nr:uncharacterized protein ONS95_007144 [Cadophora gregata]KAK0100692.1 hypothetical protein ONS95_007144 [Cadophora gregata]
MLTKLSSRGKTAYHSMTLPPLPLSETEATEATESEGDFILFTKFPKEIQIIIWEIVIADSRLIIQIMERAGQHWLTGKCIFRKHSWRKKFFTIHNHPPVLQVCSLSRELAKTTWETGNVSRQTLLDTLEYRAIRQEILEVCFVDGALNPDRSPVYAIYGASSPDSTLLANAFTFVKQCGIKSIALDLDKWSTVESEHDWGSRICEFFYFREMLTLEKVILYYSDSDMCPERLALCKFMTDAFVSRSKSHLSIIRDDAIRESIQTEEKFADCTVEEWKLPKFEFVLKSEWRQWSGVWADMRGNCLHKVPYARRVRYQIPSYRCEWDYAKWLLEEFLHWS